MKPIAVGEQVTFDYGMCETDERLWEPMECLCGTPSCRQWITANDWKRPELWDKYQGYFAPHVQRLIEEIKQQDNINNNNNNNNKNTITTTQPQPKEDDSMLETGTVTARLVEDKKDVIVDQPVIANLPPLPLLLLLPAPVNWFDRFIRFFGLARVSTLVTQTRTL